ncbi:hypothetical protein L6R49_29865, partial [Myxococcota bacterium]|nr:hypothetical protein [Myxococcota bacterium]
MIERPRFSPRPPPSPWGWGISTATALAVHGLFFLLPGLSTAPTTPETPKEQVTLTLVSLEPALTARTAGADLDALEEETPTPLDAVEPPEEAEVTPEEEAPTPPKPRRLVELNEGPEIPDPLRADHFAQRAQHADADTRAADELPATIQDAANSPGLVAQTGARAQRVNTAREEPRERRGEDIADAGEQEDRRSPAAARGAETDGLAMVEVEAPPDETLEERARERTATDADDAVAELLPMPARPAEADQEAPPTAPDGERPPGERAQAPAP